MRTRQKRFRTKRKKSCSSLKKRLESLRATNEYLKEIHEQLVLEKLRLEALQITQNMESTDELVYYNYDPNYYPCHEFLADDSKFLSNLIEWGNTIDTQNCFVEEGIA